MCQIIRRFSNATAALGAEHSATGLCDEFVDNVMVLGAFHVFGMMTEQIPCREIRTRPGWRQLEVSGRRQALLGGRLQAA